MRGAIQELGLQPTYDLDLLLRYASQVHQLRQSIEKTVSRSSLIYAGLRAQPLVRAVLEANGLRVNTFEEHLSFKETPPLDPQKGDGELALTSDATMGALRAYAETRSSRPLDAIGLVGVLLSSLDGMVERHLRTSGLHAEDASKRFDALIQASPAGAIQAGPSGYFLSGLIDRVFNVAARMLATRNVPALTSSSVLLALTDASVSDALTAPEFLRHYLVERCGEERLNSAVSEWLAWYPSERTESKIDSYSQPLAAVLERAAQIASVASNSTSISARHLVGAFIALMRGSDDLGATDFLAQLEIEPQPLARAYVSWLSEHAPQDAAGDDLSAWRRFLGVTDEVFLARFAAEQSGGEDWLNIDAHVQAFATMIASDRITPPLAVGLFGDWGSGKSFFMAKLREAVRERAERARARSNTPYHSRIVQIEFNAWHYIEANLWASLVEHVFSNLKLTTGDTEKTIAERRAEVARQIDALVADRKAAEEKLQAAEVARDQAANDLDAKKKLAETNAAGLGGLRLTDAWELVTIDEADRKALRDELNKLGVQTALASREEIRRTLDDLRAAGRRAEVTRAWALQRPWPLVVLAALIVVTPLAAPALVDWLRSLGLPDLNESMAQLLAPVGSAVAWMAARIGQANRIFGKIDGAREKIDGALRTAEEKRLKEIADADQRLKDAVSGVAKAKDDLQQKEAAVVRAQEELLELSRGRRLARFIDERAASDDYRKLLGVLATVRHDFSTLSRLMDPEDKEVEIKDEYRIDRIVLYIDDLDRCHPDRVVEVLQAVHLLLAFKLFVVVVGVDARWVSESLRQKHRALREKDGVLETTGESEVMGYAVKPHDYLEKIFQVPFWLEPLDSATTAGYIGQLLAEDVDRSLHDRQTGTAPDQLKISVRSGGSSAPAPAPRLSTATQGPVRPKSPIIVDPKALQIDPRELAFMQSPAITMLISRSPRTAKRFVNTYRFIRAGVASHELAAYLADGVLARYKAVLTLLAVVVGAPDVSLEVFDEMKNPAHAGLTLAQLTAGLEDRYGQDRDLDEWRRVWPALRALSNGRETVGEVVPLIDHVARYSFRPPYAQLAPRRQPKREPIAISIIKPSAAHERQKAALRPPSKEHH